MTEGNGPTAREFAKLEETVRYHVSWDTEHHAQTGAKISEMGAMLGEKIEDLKVNFRESSTKQGDRIGKTEGEVLGLRKDFYWAARITVGVWALIQALGLVFLGWYLK